MWMPSKPFSAYFNSVEFCKNYYFKGQMQRNLDNFSFGENPF